MQIKSYSLGPMDNNTYLLVDEATGEGAIVDPSFDSDDILGDVLSKVTTLKYVLNTHAHFDHVLGNGLFVEKTGALLALHRNDLPLLHNLQKSAARFGFEVEPSPEPVIFLQEGTDIVLGETSIQVIEAPGHAPGHVMFNSGEDLIAGDVLFKDSIGRTDLPGGSMQTLLESIKYKILTLPDSVRVLPGHGEATTVGRERIHNQYLVGL